MGIVYKAVNLLDGTSYIGATRQTLAQRRYYHENAAKKQPRWMQLIAKAIREYGSKHFEWSVIREVPDEQLSEAEEREILAARERGEQLYNVSNGPGLLGAVHSAETRAKIGAKHKGKSISAEQRAGMSERMKGKTAHNKGKPMPDAQRAKLSAKLKEGYANGSIAKQSRPWSAEDRTKLSEIKTGKPLVFFEGKSYAEWAAELNDDVRAVQYRILRYGSPYPHRVKIVVEGKDLHEWAAELGVCYHTARYRYRKFGHPAKNSS